VLCPEVVGRDREQDLLRGRVDGLAEGRGGVVALVGEAGAGKSLLARQATDGASAAGLRVLEGRAVPGASPLPFRPLTEAFLAAFRTEAPPDDRSLGGFGTHLGRLVPAWRDDTRTAAEESPVLLGEAVVRLLAVHGQEEGTVLLLEDLHWADAETIAVLDYLADALRSEPVLCLVTSRPGGAADEVLARLGRRDPTAVVSVDALSETEVDRMLAACLSGATPAGDLSAFVRTHSDGNPFLIEELLAGLASSGALQLDAGGWRTTGALTPTVPASLRDSIHRRLTTLDPSARRVLGAAALLGRSFAWELLPGVAEVDGAAAVEGLRAAVGEQLIEVDGTAFTFRHALTREAVLAELLPPERRDLATRAWPAHERANPDLPGPTLELAADLAEAAGDSVAAARHLIESARRAMSNGALTTAEATARRATRLAQDDPAVALDADEVLLRVLVAAGKPGDALALGRELAARLDHASEPERQADLLIVTARAALAAGDGVGAARAADAARSAAGEEPDPGILARLDVVAAEVALDQADLDVAARLARAAVEGASASGQPAVEGEAWIVLGHVTRAAEGMEVALSSYRRAGEVAAAAGLAPLHLRALQEQALVSWSDGNAQPLHEVRTLAVRYGALVSVAVVDLTLADMALSSYDRDACLEAAVRCVEASRRYGLAAEPVAHLWLAGAHALAGDPDAMHAAIADALAPDPDDPRLLGDLYGRVLPTAAFVDDDLDRLPSLLDTMIEHVRVAPATTSVYPGRILWAMWHTVHDDDLGAAPRAEFTHVFERLGIPVFAGCGDLIEAVVLGRQGQAEAATARFTPAYDRFSTHPFGSAIVFSSAMLAAEPALRDGWGEPVRWLREAEAFFGGRGYGRLARRCRTMLGAAGAPVPRRGRGDSEVPPGLRGHGVTSREVDVLKLVAAGRTNKEVAEELFLSPKTVERHLSSLFSRLDVTNRRDLVDRARPHLGASEP